MGLKILHLSDIHFRHFKDHQYLDLDKDIQSELEFDLKSIKKLYDKIDIILIGGDIAFSGQEAEYHVADEWIKRICSITGCEQENVLMVPGNHDVNRKKLNENIKDVHKIFRSLKDRNNIDYKIGKYVTDPDAAMTLLSPLDNYHAFAQKYGSIPNADNRLFWEKDFILDQSILRIRGVNSALISDEDDDENNGKLILGSHQSLINRANGVINMVLCHHPPQWLYDGNEVHSDLKARARLHLFGHKHVFDSETIDGKCLVLSAGAMQPSRGESEWEPRYNIIELSVPTVLQTPILKINLFKRVWSTSKRKFIADFDDDGKIFVEHNLTLTEEEVVHHVPPVVNVNINELNVVPMATPIIDLSSPDPRRKLAFLYLGLPYHIRLGIAAELGLIEDSDKNISEVQKAQMYFKRANERNLLHELWDRVAKFSNVNTSNPFAENL